ncbi:DUF1788 domain-containing protein [Anabaenopsis elenkinii]|uniref:DUF1788 domain-containing protein n=1 Tax=Anabaenopsis elenkinii CCIBt3563 TaxID=2779889 RepID=A0A7U3NLC8_9CYAN|nr:DUF1788 domain-containing protein [Anabaenopsis elenkinii]QOV21429.1 DUF1788 domain-containing protein [Anabaenopsis elenkinii CCIBt3563]
MPTLTIHQRLDALLPKLQDTRLLSNRGIGNEIGFYIFDYDAEYEPLVHEYIEGLKSQLINPPSGVIFLEVNLYRTILEILQERKLLGRAFELEANKGNAALAKTIAPLVRPEQVITHIQKQLQGDEQLVLMTGVGASWPLVRSHTILNNLHPILDKIPLVMFFPGSYDGHELRLFNTFKDDNYYRAFPLIPHNYVYEY